MSFAKSCDRAATRLVLLKACTQETSCVNQFLKDSAPDRQFCIIISVDPSSADNGVRRKTRR